MQKLEKFSKNLKDFEYFKGDYTESLEKTIDYIEWKLVVIKLVRMLEEKGCTLYIKCGPEYTETINVYTREVDLELVDVKKLQKLIKTKVNQLGDFILD